MHKKLALSIGEAVYDGLHRVVGRGNISRFIDEDLDGPCARRSLTFCRHTPLCLQRGRRLPRLQYDRAGHHVTSRGGSKGRDFPGRCRRHRLVGSPFLEQLPAAIDAASTRSGITRCQVVAAPQGTFKTSSPELRQVEAIQVHHLVPGRHKVTYERLLRVAARIDLCEGSEL